MFDDTSDRDWELAALVCEQSRLATKEGTLTPAEKTLYRIQAKRIEQLLDQVTGEIPNWQSQHSTGSGQMWVN